MKKLISVLLALTLVVGLVACGNSGGGETEGEKLEVPASALEILEKIWNAYGEDKPFYAMGGDYGNPVENAPGNYSLTDEGLTSTLLVPADQVANIDQAASLIHGMMLNNFSAGVYHVTGDATAFAEAMHTVFSNNRWLCGTPEKQLIAVIGGQYVLAVFGLDELLTGFESKLTTVYPQAAIKYSEAIA